MGFGRKFARRQQGNPPKRPVKLDVSLVPPGRNEIGLQGEYRRHSLESSEAAARFLARVEKPVVWVVGPGEPGNLLEHFIDSLHREQASVGRPPDVALHLTDTYFDLLGSLHKRFSQKSGVRIFLHPGRFPRVDSTPPVLPHAVFLQNVSQFLTDEEQEAAAALVAGILQPGGRLYYTYSNPQVRLKTVRLAGNTVDTSLHTDSRRFHDAVGRRMTVVQSKPVSGEPVRYAVAEKRGG